MEWRLGTWKSKKGTSVALGAVAETDKGSEPAAGPAKAHREIRRRWFLKTGYPILYRIIISFPNRMAIHGYPVFLYMFIYTFIIIYPIQSSCVYSWDEWRWMKRWDINVAMDQYLYIPFLGGWTSIYQLFWCELQGDRVLTHPHVGKSSKVQTVVMRVALQLLLTAGMNPATLSRRSQRILRTQGGNSWNGRP